MRNGFHDLPNFGVLRFASESLTPKQAAQYAERDRRERFGLVLNRLARLQARLEHELADAAADKSLVIPPEKRAAFKDAADRLKHLLEKADCAYAELTKAHAVCAERLDELYALKLKRLLAQ